MHAERKSKIRASVRFNTKTGWRRVTPRLKALRFDRLNPHSFPSICG